MPAKNMMVYLTIKILEIIREEKIMHKHGKN